MRKNVIEFVRFMNIGKKLQLSEESSFGMVYCVRFIIAYKNTINSNYLKAAEVLFIYIFFIRFNIRNRIKLLKSEWKMIYLSNRLKQNGR